MSKSFKYEGDVVLLCQEGGFASPSIELCDVTAETLPPGITGKVRVLFSGESFGATLDEILKDQFGVERMNSCGDERVGKLRITVEKLDNDA